MELKNGYKPELPAVVERKTVTNNNDEKFEVRIQPNQRKAIK